jgi:hypothetical protein
MSIVEIVFEVKKEHLVLLRKMCVGWNDCEFGAPEIDPKRPYGNSDAVGDMVEIFGKKVSPGVFKVNVLGKDYYIDCDGDTEDSVAIEDVLRKLHRETETVLQIILSTGLFREGRYKLKQGYGSDWEYIGV